MIMSIKKKNLFFYLLGKMYLIFITRTLKLAVACYIHYEMSLTTTVLVVFDHYFIKHSTP